jgi:REP element-mobilizing transposase RayT
MQKVMVDRKSKMVLNEVYFWTDTVKDWKCILEKTKYKKLIIDTLRQLVSKKLVRVFGFVIMPNHIHLIWEMCAKNGKEMPHASFNKATGHIIIRDLKCGNHVGLQRFQVNDRERQYRIWQRDPLAVLMDYREKLEQKLDYIHLNPLQEKWSFVEHPEDYPWSSARYYETGVDDFGFLTHYTECF